MLRVYKESLTGFPKSFSYGLVTNIESTINRGCQRLLHLRRVGDYRKTLKPNEGVGELQSRVLGMSGNNKIYAFIASR